VEPQNNYSKLFFKIKEANWEKFSDSTTNVNNIYPITTSINKEAATINKILIESAHFSIPQSSRNLHSHKVPWWNKKLTQIHQTKKNAWKTLNGDISQANIISYCRANGLFKREIKIRKTSHLHLLYKVTHRHQQYGTTLDDSVA